MFFDPIAGYHDNIAYTTEILGFDADGHAYLLKDSFWATADLEKTLGFKNEELTPKEKEAFDILVRLGDPVELAYKTVLSERDNELKKDHSRDFYSFAYED